MTTHSSRQLGLGGGVTLEVPTDHDAAVWFELFNDVEVMRYIGDGSIRDRTWYEQTVARQQRWHVEHGYCLFSLKLASETVGFVGLHPWSLDWGPTGQIELGWRLGREYWGRGLAERGARQALEIAEAHGVQPISLIYQANVRSIRLAKRLGATCQRSLLPPGGLPVAEYLHRPPGDRRDAG